MALGLLDNEGDLRRWLEGQLQEPGLVPTAAIPNLPAAVPPGALMAYAGASAPAGYLLCDGSAVSRSTYAGLFDAIGTAYGVGDGSTTFNLPDLTENVSPVGMGAGDSLGDTGGAATVALTTANMAAHSHGFSGDANNNTTIGGVADRIVNLQNGTTGSQDRTTTTEGSGDAHENMPPYLVCNWIVKV